MKKPSLPLHALCICTSLLVTNLAGAATSQPASKTPSPSMYSRAKGAAKQAASAAGRVSKSAITSTQNLATRAKTGVLNLKDKTSTSVKNTQNRIENKGKKNEIKKSQKRAQTAQTNADAERKKAEHSEKTAAEYRKSGDEQSAAYHDAQAQRNRTAETQFNQQKAGEQAKQARLNAERKGGSYSDAQDPTTGLQPLIHNRNQETQATIDKRNAQATATITKRNENLKPKPTTTENTAVAKAQEADTAHKEIEAGLKQTPMPIVEAPPLPYEEATKPSAPTEGIYPKLPECGRPRRSWPHKISPLSLLTEKRERWTGPAAARADTKEITDEETLSDASSSDCSGNERLFSGEFYLCGCPFRNNKQQWRWLS